MCSNTYTTRVNVRVTYSCPVVSIIITAVLSVGESELTRIYQTQRIIQADIDDRLPEFSSRRKVDNYTRTAESCKSYPFENRFDV